MKTLIAVLAFSLGASAHATKLLDCNTPVGPDQEVTVTSERDGSLSIIELTSQGAMLPKRTLSQAEWSAQKITLSDGETLLLKEKGDWIVRSDTDFAFADCF